MKGLLSPKVFLVIGTILLSSCQGGGGGSSTGDSAVSGSGGVLGLQLSGVGVDGPVTGGNVDFQGADGQSCGDIVTTDAQGNYAAVIPLDCTFPLVVNLTGGYDLVSKDTNYTDMYSVALDNGTNLANITPLTTIIYYAALARTKDSGLSALNSSTLDFVTKTVMRYFNFGIDSVVDPDFVGGFNPLTIKVCSHNACVFVKASEGLMEAVRRTALYSSGTLDNGAINEVLKALGDDIADGVLDGLAVDGSASLGGTHLASLWNLNAANVSMELMQNKFSLTLQDGTVVPAASATGTNRRLLDAAEQVSGSVFDDTDINNVDLSYNFIRQARAAALATDVLEGGGTVYSDFASLLNTLVGDVKLQSSGLQTVDGTIVQQRFGSASPLISIPDDSAVGQIVDDMGASGSTSMGISYKMALAQSIDIMNESTPVFSNSHQLHIEWSYPDAVINQNGFKIYMVVNNATEPQICSVAGAKVRSADCSLVAGPGDSVNVYMTATMTSGQESTMSVDYTNILPAVQFSADNISGSCPLATDLDSSGMNSPASGASRAYSWDLGDGSIDTGASLSHQFNYSNSYNVTLTVTDTMAGVFSVSSQAELGVDCL